MMKLPDELRRQRQNREETKIRDSKEVGEEEKNKFCLQVFHTLIVFLIECKNRGIQDTKIQKGLMDIFQMKFLFGSLIPF